MTPVTSAGLSQKENPVLELENITAGYGDTVVLRDVSLSVPDSKVVALLGPTGPARPPCCGWPRASSSP